MWGVKSTLNIVYYVAMTWSGINENKMLFFSSSLSLCECESVCGMQFSEFIVQQIEHFVSVFRIYSFRHQRMCFSSVFFFMSSFFVMWCKYERWSFLFASIFRHWLNGESIGLQPISNVLLLLLLLLYSGITMYYVVTIDNPKVSQLVEWLLRFECLKTVTDVQLKSESQCVARFHFIRMNDEWNEHSDHEWNQ